MPVASADVSCHVPDIALVPDEAAAIQSEGKFNVATTVPASAVAHVAGTEPVRMRMMAEVPIVDSTASRRAFRTAVLYCKLMIFHLYSMLPHWS